MMLFLGVLIGGAIMYYIQPVVHDMVVSAFQSVPTLEKKAASLKARADILLNAVRERDDTPGSAGAA